MFRGKAPLIRITKVGYPATVTGALTDAHLPSFPSTASRLEAFLQHTKLLYNI